MVDISPGLTQYGLLVQSQFSVNIRFNIALITSLGHCNDFARYNHYYIVIKIISILEIKGVALCAPFSRLSTSGPGQKTFAHPISQKPSLVLCHKNLHSSYVIKTFIRPMSQKPNPRMELN